MLPVGTDAGRSHYDGREAGFTLIEVLAALIIVVLAVRVVALNIARPPGPSDLSAMASQIAQQARAVREKALRQGREAVLLVDVGARRIGTAPGLKVRNDMTIEAVVADSERIDTATAGIRFYPNGSSTGGTIRLLSGALRYEVRVNWLTGRVHVVPNAA